MVGNLSALLLLLFLTRPCLAAPQVLSPELNAMRRQGFDALFNMDYERARSYFQKMIEIDPNHPAGYVYLANTIWLGHLTQLRRLQTSIYNRGDSFFAETKEEFDTSLDRLFRETINKGAELAEKRLRQNKQDPAGYYYLGIAKNVLAGYEASVKRSFFSALKNGSRGVDLHRDLTKKHPDFIDAYLSVGVYEYVVGSLPFAVKVLAFLGGVRGSKKKGLELLEKVRKEGNFAREEATVILIMLYNREKRFVDCLRLLDDLTARYPGNLLFALERATTLAQSGQFRKSHEAFEAILRNDRAVNYLGDLIHYQYGIALTQSYTWERAAEQFLAVPTFLKAPASLITMAHLNAGLCFDAAGERERAIQQYKIVMKRREAFDSHDLAKKYLEKPYRP